MRRKDDACLVILNYNDSVTTLKLINSVCNYRCFKRIIVVDNKSTDDSYLTLKKCGNNKIDVIQTDKNGGYAYGNNYGIRYAILKYLPTYICIANPDVYFEENVIEKLIEFLDNNKKFGVVAPRMKSNISYAYNSYNFFECMCSMFLIITKLLKKINSKKKKELLFFSGSFFVISKEAFEAVDGFDEKTFLYCEEIILRKRLDDKKYKYCILDDVFFEHNHSVTINKVYKSKIKPFKLYISSLKYYLFEYEKIGFLKKVIFYVLYFFAFIERLLYDITYKIIKKW